jgi:hypothetical protein
VPKKSPAPHKGGALCVPFHRVFTAPGFSRGFRDRPSSSAPRHPRVPSPNLNLWVNNPQGTLPQVKPSLRFCPMFGASWARSLWLALGGEPDDETPVAVVGRNPGAPPSPGRRAEGPRGAPRPSWLSGAHLVGIASTPTPLVTGLRGLNARFATRLAAFADLTTLVGRNARLLCHRPDRCR